MAFRVSDNIPQAITKKKIAKPLRFHNGFISGDRDMQEIHSVINVICLGKTDLGVSVAQREHNDVID